MSSAILNLSSAASNVAAAASPAHYAIIEAPEEHMPVSDDMVPVTSDEVQMSPRPLRNSTRSTKARHATFQHCLQPSLELVLMGASSCGSSISGINTSLYLNTHLAAALPEPTALFMGQAAVAMPQAERESLDLLAAVKASICVSLSSLSGISTSLYLSKHEAAAVREPTLLDHLRWMRESLERHLKEHEAASVPEPSTPACKQTILVERMRQSLDLMAALQASCESLSGVDISSYLKEHEAASVPEPEPTTSVTNQRQGVLAMPQGVHESLDLLAPFRASVASSISGIDADLFLSSHEAASVPEPAAAVPDRSALLVKKMRESLDLLAALRASCQSISGEDIEAFYREHPLAEADATDSSDSDAVDTPCTSSGATSCCGTASALLSSSSSSSLVAAAWSVESSCCTENMPSCYCPASAPDQEQEREEQEEEAGMAPTEEKLAASEPEAKAEAESSSARKSRGGCLKRKVHKLRKMMRGVWGSFVNAL